MWPKPQPGSSDPKGSPSWEGGGLGHVGAIFCSWALLDFFWMLLLIFFYFLIDFEWILGGFWEGFGGFWEGLNKIFRIFFAFLSKIAIL